MGCNLALPLQALRQGGNVADFNVRSADFAQTPAARFTRPG